MDALRIKRPILTNTPSEVSQLKMIKTIRELDRIQLSGLLRNLETSATFSGDSLVMNAIAEQILNPIVTGGLNPHRITSLNVLGEAIGANYRPEWRQAVIKLIRSCKITELNEIARGILQNANASGDAALALAYFEAYRNSSAKDRRFHDQHLANGQFYLEKTQGKAYATSKSRGGLVDCIRGVLFGKFNR